MIGVKVNAAKSMFFDRVVITAVNRAEIGVLSRMGSFVRTSSRTSIKKASGVKIPKLKAKLRNAKTAMAKQKAQDKLDDAIKKQTSRPGEPPKGHGAQFLKRFIYFGFDSATRSTVVGPVRLNGRKSIDAPSILEGGGRTKIGTQTVEIEARPYMGPALVANSPKFPSLWANTVKP